MLMGLGGAVSAHGSRRFLDGFFLGWSCVFLFLFFLRRQILQIEVSVRAENQTRIKVGESNLADAQLKWLQIKLQSVERQRFPFQQILVRQSFPRCRKSSNLDTALVVYLRRTIAAGIESEIALGVPRARR